MLTKKHITKMPVNKKSLRLTGISFLLFSMLLMATPFLMLRNYLQTSVRRLSELEVTVFGADFHIVVFIAIVLSITMLILFRRRLRLLHPGLFIAAIILIAIGQKTTDFYLNFGYYDLQNNWHYFAYGIFAFIALRHFRNYHFSSTKIILLTYVSALFISAFDEGLQFFISSRVFDISDISKDVWGVTIGLIVINFAGKTDEIKAGLGHLRQPRLGLYPGNPLTALILLTALSYIFMFVSALLTDLSRWHLIFIITGGLFLVFFAVFHLSQFRLPKIILITIGVLALGAQVYSLARYHDRGIVYSGEMVTVYRGFVLPFFDIMIFPDGSFRFTDKKESFKQGDMLTIFKQKADIFLIGNGPDGDGGKLPQFSKFIEYEHFRFNRYTIKGMQIGIMKNPDACRLFNELKKNRYKVLFVIHNS